MERKVVRLDENTVAELRGDNVTLHQRDLLGSEQQVSVYLKLDDLRKVLANA